METVKHLSPDYLIRKSGIPCKTLHNFTFFNYKSNVILSKIADKPPYLRESRSEIKRDFCIPYFLQSLRFTIDGVTATSEISGKTTVQVKSTFLLECVFSRFQMHKPLFKGIFINSPLKPFVPCFFPTKWLLFLVSLRIYVSVS